MAKCDCYYQHGMKFVCYGTKEMEECACGGDASKCDFYPEKRNKKAMATEKRLIDAKDVKELINGLSELPWEEEVDYLVDSLPTVDAVEVVRCKDCCYRGNPDICPMCYEEQIEWDDDGYTEFDWILHDSTQDEGFCEGGERKNNEG